MEGLLDGVVPTRREVVVAPLANVALESASEAFALGYLAHPCVEAGFVDVFTGASAGARRYEVASWGGEIFRAPADSASRDVIKAWSGSED